MANRGMVTDDSARQDPSLPVVRVLVTETRWERFGNAVARRAWVGRKRRVGIARWVASGTNRRGLPLLGLGPQGIQSQVYRTAKGSLKWVRLPLTTWCLSTYRRKP